MTREATVTIPLKQWKGAQDRIDQVAKNFRETNARQVEIINRLYGELKGMKLVVAVLLDDAFHATGEEPVRITNKELTEAEFNFTIENTPEGDIVVTRTTEEEDKNDVQQ